MNRACLCLYLVLVCVGSPGGSIARAAPPPAPDAALDTGEAAFRVQDYDAVVAALLPIVATPTFATHPNRLRVLELLGASQWFLGDREAARRAFTSLLAAAPVFTLDPFIYPAELIEFLVRIRSSLIRDGLIPDDGASHPPPLTIIREVTHNTTPVVAYLAPFGVGQFANGDSTKGVAFAVSQGVGVAVMAAAWLGVEALKLPDSRYVARSDAGQAHLLEGLWYGGLTLALGSWIYSVVDGLVLRESAPHIEERVEAPEARAPTWRLGPAGLGVGVDVGF